MRRRLSITACVAFSLALSGCYNDTMWWEYRDDPYIADMAKKGDQEVLRNLNSTKKEHREIALRILAYRAGVAREQGRRESAQEMEAMIIRRYLVEKEQDVRAGIVRICAPAVGRGSSAMVTFLRERIAAGEFPGYAALSLASLGPRNAWEDIDPLTKHPAPEVRLQAAEALVVLRDPRGYETVQRVWSSMKIGAWPDRIDGVPLLEAKSSLEMRANRSFGRSL